MTDKNFSSIEEVPEEISTVNVICRMLDGLGFRFYWVTEGMTKEQYYFKPDYEYHGISELVSHIWDLVNWMHTGLFDEEVERPESIIDQRNHILEIIEKLRDRFQNMSPEDLDNVSLNGLPFWNLINGPIADALSHVGEISVLRSLAGYPNKKAQFFSGKPPT